MIEKMRPFLVRIINPFLFRPNIHFARASSTIADADYSSILSPPEFSRVQNLYKGIIEQKRASLAESITLVESTLPRRRIQSRMLLELVLKNLRERQSRNQHTFRIGLSGPPGAGKSTFIETFGTMLTQKNYRVAILAVDPSSKGTGGSLLADKTRMPELSRNPQAYIRPSPSRGNLGGVARNTNDAVILCEGAGYDIIVVETVGVGQSEFAVADMVDLFCLLIPPAGGDELQGIKKGIVEAADIVVVNKFDGDLKPAARRVAAEYMSALKFVKPRSKLWKQKVLKVSSVQQTGLEELWEKMKEFEEIMRSDGELTNRRQQQLTVWMWNYVKDEVLHRFMNNPEVREVLPLIEEKVICGSVTPGHAAEHLLKLFTTTGT